MNSVEEVLFELGRLLIPGRMDPSREFVGLFGDVWLYLILFFAIIVLFMQPEGSMVATLAMAAVILSVFMDKVMAFSSIQGGYHPCSLGTLLIRALMFLGPLLVAGISRNPKSRAPAVVGGLLAGAYLFFMWFFEMNTAACPMLARDFSAMMDFFVSSMPFV